MLSNIDENRLVVRARVDGTHSVGTSIQARRDISGQDTILSWIVETLEEREDGRVQSLCGTQRIKLLNDDMAVAYNETISVDGLQAVFHKGNRQRVLHQEASK